MTCRANDDHCNVLPLVTTPQGAPVYQVPDDEVVTAALDILRRRMRSGDILRSPNDVKAYLCVCSASYGNREVFSALFVDAHQRVLSHDLMFYGTLTLTSVHPRELVHRAIQYGAASVIVSHNHPSGDAKPSPADERLTQILKSALALVDIKLLDHLIVAGSEAYSMAEHGLV